MVNGKRWRNNCMDDAIIPFFMGILFSLIVFCIFIVPSISHENYKQGQIDYANDIIKYELREQDNHEYIWVEKEGN
jgi:hypothetical protein